MQEEEDERLPQKEEEPADDEQKSDSTGAESRSGHAEIKQQFEHAQDSNNGAELTHDSRHAPEHRGEDAQHAEDEGHGTQHVRENRHDSEHADEVRHSPSIGQQSYTQDIFADSQVSFLFFVELILEIFFLCNLSLIYRNLTNKTRFSCNLRNWFISVDR